MRDTYTPTRRAGKGPDAPPVLEFPRQPTSLHRQLAAALGRRWVAMVFPPGRDSADPEEVFYVIRGDIIAQLELLDGAGADFHDRHFGTVDVVPGSVFAATATVRA